LHSSWNLPHSERPAISPSARTTKALPRMGRALARLPAATDATGVPRTTTEEARVAAAIRIALGECNCSRGLNWRRGFQTAAFDGGSDKA